MSTKNDLLFHNYKETYKGFNVRDGRPVTYIDPAFPFVITHYDKMDRTAQAVFPH